MLGPELSSARPGSIVRYRDADFVVERVLHFEEGGQRWIELRLSSDTAGRSLSVEIHAGGPQRLIAYEPGSAADEAPHSPQLEHEGVTYELVSRGNARYTSAERAGPSKSGTLSYVEYASGDRRLAFERYEDAPTWAVSAGRTLPPEDLELRLP